MSDLMYLYDYYMREAEKAENDFIYAMNMALARKVAREIEKMI